MEKNGYGLGRMIRMGNGLDSVIFSVIIRIIRSNP